MGSRQDGVPVESLYDSAEGDVAKLLVIKAYMRPRYYTGGFQQQEIDEFVTRAFIACKTGVLNAATL